MRVAMIVNGFPETSEKFIVNQVTGLMDRGVELDVFAALKPPAARVHELADRYRLVERTKYLCIARSLRARAAGLPALFARNAFRHPAMTAKALSPRYATVSRNFKTLHFLDAFAGRRYDVLHCHFGPNGLIGAFLKDCGFADRLVVTFHGSDINSYPRRHGEGVYETLYDRADAVTAGTSFTKGKLVANGCPEGRIRVLPMGVRMEEYPEAKSSERSPRTILAVGRLVDHKGFRYLIEAMATVRLGFPDATLRIVGEGGELSALEREVSELGLGDAVSFLGAKRGEEMAALYRSASIFVLPSIKAPDGAEEGQGFVLQEAQASGLPVIGSRIGGIPEGIVEDKTGFLVPEKDPAALADRIVALLGDASLRERMGDAGRAFVEANYAIPVLTEKLVSIYRESAISRS
jgi:colanic acid/amylovoran biosynthesis glycosyltransferase